MGLGFLMMSRQEMNSGQEPDSIWAVLGLDEDVRDKKQIKRAYARAIKEYRPDTHPEKFREIRDAYEHLLQLLKFEERIGATDIAVEEPEKPAELRAQDSVQVDTEAQSQQILDNVARLYQDSDEEEAALGDKATVPESLPDLTAAEQHNLGEAIQALNEKFAVGSISVHDWQRELLSKTQDRPQILSSHVSHDLLFREMDNDQTQITHIILEQRVHAGDYAGLKDFAVEWLEASERICLVQAGLFSMFLAYELAVVNHDLAERLFKNGYENLTPGQQESGPVYFAERMIAAGRELRYYPESLRVYVAHILHTEKWVHDPNSEQSTALIERLGSLFQDSECRFMLAQRAPELLRLADEYADKHGSKRRNQNRQADSRRRGKRRQTKRVSQEPESGFPWVLIWIIVVVLSQIGRCANRGSTTSYSYTPPASQYQFNPPNNLNDDERFRKALENLRFNDEHLNNKNQGLGVGGHPTTPP